VIRSRRSIAAVSAALIFGLVTPPSRGWADHGPGIPVHLYVPRNVDESEILRLIRTVADGWTQKNADLILSVYAPDAVQRAWNEPTRMIGVDGIRSEALGAFADPRLGRVRFEDWIHRIYIVNTSAVVEINQRFHGWGRDHYYRDFWMFARRDGRWWLLRYDYEPQTPFQPPK
jgi:hypothetical protein